MRELPVGQARRAKKIVSRNILAVRVLPVGQARMAKKNVNLYFLVVQVHLVGQARRGKKIVEQDILVGRVLLVQELPVAPTLREVLTAEQARKVATTRPEVPMENRMLRVPRARSLGTPRHGSACKAPGLLWPPGARVWRCWR